MNLGELQHGTRTTIELTTSRGESLDGLASGMEVRLIPQDGEAPALLLAGDQVWEMQGANAGQRNELQELFERTQARLCWLVQVVPAGTAVIQIHEFARHLRWEGPLDIGVDDKVIEDVSGLESRSMTTNDVIEWLHDKFLLPGVDGRFRTVLRAGADPESDETLPVAFRLQGMQFAADLARTATGSLLLTRLMRSPRAVSNRETRPVMLAEGPFAFVDATVAREFDASGRSELERIVQQAGNSYIALWSDYNRLEQERLVERANAAGWLQYQQCQLMHDGRWRFLVEQDLDRVRAFQSAIEQEEVEANDDLPAEMGGVGDRRERSRAGAGFSGKWFGVRRDQGQYWGIVGSQGYSQDDTKRPPEKGFLFLSLSGSRTVLQRREKALTKIAEGHSAMPQLGLLLEGRPVPERRRGAVRPLSPESKQFFRGEPTPRQIEALQVALNTPDIALIQGPPGTGKTRVIAALEQRLGEIVGERRSIAGDILLTSFQHDAVLNAAEATRVYGLPAVRVGGRKGDDFDSKALIDRWRTERMERVRADLELAGTPPAKRALVRVKSLALQYFEQPVEGDARQKLLRDVRECAQPWITPDLCDRLQSLERDSPADLQFGDELDRELIERSVRGLRMDAAGFSDDGPVQANRALQRLRKHNVLEHDEEVLLQAAAEADPDAPGDLLPRLERLQQDLLLRLQPTELPAGPLPVHEGVQEVLSDTVDELSQAVRRSRHGVEAVLEDYLQDLEFDPDGVRRTIEEYTAVLAATCQQAAGYPMADLKGQGAFAPDDHGSGEKKSPTFNTVIVDEAARVPPLDLAIPMSMALKRIILVGDHRQLPHILDDEIEREIELNRSASEATRDVLHTSLFARMFGILQDLEARDGIRRTVTLDVQYRMHPVLGDFVSDVFYQPYGEGFRSGRAAEQFAHGLEQYETAVGAWIDVPLHQGGEQRESTRSYRRMAEARRIAEEARRILDANPDLSVGVITFYSAQVHAIREEMVRVGLAEPDDDGVIRIAAAYRNTTGADHQVRERLRVGTVDSFQGKEFDVVLLSMTRSNDLKANDPRVQRAKYGHLMLENRLCVAMSRQQRLLIVVGDAAMLQGEVAAEAVPGLVRFYELCGGPHGVRIPN